VAKNASRPGRRLIVFALIIAAMYGAVALAGEWKPKLGLDLQGGTRITLEASTQTARAITLHAARLRDRGLPFSREASVAKLVATDNAMKVTTDAVQVFGGYGYTRDFPVERYMREAKVMQIFEGTNQIQRMVISRRLAR